MKLILTFSEKTVRCRVCQGVASIFLVSTLLSFFKSGLSAPHYCTL